MDRLENPEEQRRDFKDIRETLEQEELWTESRALQELWNLKDIEIERLRKVSKEALKTLNHGRIFIDCRQKMYKDGVVLYDECLEKLQKALKEGE